MRVKVSMVVAAVASVCALTSVWGEEAVVQRLGFELGEDLAGCQPSGRFSFVEGVGEASSRALVWDGPEISNARENFVFPSFPVEPGREYHYRLKARCDGDIVGRVYVHMRYSTDTRTEAFEGRPVVNNRWKKGGKWVEISGGTTMLPPDAKSGSVAVTIRDKSTGKMVFDNLVVTATPRRYIRFLQSSPYRDCAVDGTVKFVATYLMAPSECPLAKRRPEFLVQGADGKERRLAAQEVAADWFAGSCAVADLAMGEHPIVARLLSDDGREFDRATITFQRVETLPDRQVFFDSHHRLIVDGKPFFPLGMSGCGANDAETDIYTNSPLNCAFAGNPAAFERAAAHGLKVIFGASHLATASESAVKEMCRKYGRRKELLVWCTNDELPPGFVSRQTTLYRRLREYDPDHPVYAVLDKYYHVRDFMPSFDFIIMDPYPVGNRKRGGIDQCTVWPRKASEAVFGIRPVWQEPQAFNWEWHRRNFNASSPEHHFPTRDEFRSMAWQPIALGVKGFIWYSFDWLLHESTPEEFKVRWGYMKETFADIARFSPVFLSVEKAPAATCDNAAVTVKTWRHDGSVWLAVVNTTEEAQTAHVRPACKVKAGATAVEIGTAPTMNGDRLDFALPPLGFTFMRWADSPREN